MARPGGQKEREREREIEMGLRGNERERERVILILDSILRILSFGKTQPHTHTQPSTHFKCNPYIRVGISGNAAAIIWRVLRSIFKWFC